VVKMNKKRLKNNKLKLLFRKINVFIIEHEFLFSGILFFIALFFISFKVALIIALIFGIILTGLCFISITKWKTFELQPHHLDFEVLENEL